MALAYWERRILNFTVSSFRIKAYRQSREFFHLGFGPDLSSSVSIVKCVCARAAPGVIPLSVSAKAKVSYLNLSCCVEGVDFILQRVNCVLKIRNDIDLRFFRDSRGVFDLVSVLAVAPLDTDFLSDGDALNLG